MVIDSPPKKPSWFYNVIGYWMMLSPKFYYYKGITLVLKENMLTRKVWNPSWPSCPVWLVLQYSDSKKINICGLPNLRKHPGWVKSYQTCVWRWLFQSSAQGLENDQSVVYINKPRQQFWSLLWGAISWVWTEKKSPTTASVCSMATATWK